MFTSVQPLVQEFLMVGQPHSAAPPPSTLGKNTSVYRVPPQNRASVSHGRLSTPAHSLVSRSLPLAPQRSPYVCRSRKPRRSTWLRDKTSRSIMPLVPSRTPPIPGENAALPHRRPHSLAPSRLGVTSVEAIFRRSSLIYHRRSRFRAARERS